MLPRHDMDRHMKEECFEYTKKCEVCGDLRKPNKVGLDSAAGVEEPPHDCLQNLKRLREQFSSEENILDLQFGIHYRDMELLCPQGTRLVAHSGLHVKYLKRGANISYKCKKCSRSELNKFEMYYACPDKGCPCDDYFVCRLCAL